MPRLLCVNPRCNRYPIRGSSLCGACETKKDAMVIIAVLIGCTLLLIGIVKAFAIVGTH